MVSERFYQETSLVPVAEEIAWERVLFHSGAATIARQLGYEAWKEEETARTLENIFRGAVGSGKTFDEAVSEVEEAVQRAISHDESGNSS